MSYSEAGIWSSLPNYCWVVYCHCECVLQLQAVPVKIKPFGTWIEPKFICSKELERVYKKAAAHLNKLACNKVNRVNCTWINIILFKITKAYLE
jgi:hypothetical protein